MTPHENITSASNPRVREASLLREADARRATGLTLVDGRRELSRAAAAGVAIVEVFLDAETLHSMARGTAAGGNRFPDPSPFTDPATEEALIHAWRADCALPSTRLTMLSRKAFEKLAFGSRNEGCVGVVRFAGQPLEHFTAAPDRPVLIVEGVEKPGNLGAIVRTADATGSGGVIVCDGRTDPANPAVIRASLGTVFSVPLAVANATQTIAWCKANNRRVVAAMPGGTRLWHEANVSEGVAILLGSEAHGITPLWEQAAADGTIRWESVRLPMAGAADSLNVSATAAVLAYEAMRQRI